MVKSGRDFGQGQTDLLARKMRDFGQHETNCTMCKSAPPYAQYRAQPPLRPGLHEILASANQVEPS